MVDYESDDDDPKASRFSLRAFLVRDWPYLAMLALALFGVSYTSIARQAMTNYWIVLAPLYGVICVISRWRNIESTVPLPTHCVPGCFSASVGWPSSGREGRRKSSVTPVAFTGFPVS